MPNHVQSRVKFFGDRGKIEALLKRVMIYGDEDRMVPDFTKIIPRPKYILTNTSAFSEIHKEYGEKDNWYDWQTDNWGTKWNAYAPEAIAGYDMCFTTAWAVPMPILRELSMEDGVNWMEIEVDHEGEGYYAIAICKGWYEQSDTFNSDEGEDEDEDFDGTWDVDYYEAMREVNTKLTATVKRNIKLGVMPKELQKGVWNGNS